jgi:hypothetical protein
MGTLYLLFILLLGFLTSCNPVAGGKQASTFGTDFNPGIPTEKPNIPVPQAKVGGVNGFKVTTGAQGMIGSNLAAKVTIITNDEKLSGSQVSGRFSINKTQVR